MNATALPPLLPRLPHLPEALEALVQQGDRAGFAQLVAEARAAERGDPGLLLGLAHAALQLGLIDLGDELVVEADALAPEAGLIPDRWGLWPRAATTPANLTSWEPGGRELVLLYLEWRHGPGVPIWEAWHRSVRQRWQSAGEYRQQALLQLLLNRMAPPPEWLLQELERLVGEAQLAADPAAALAFWGPMSRRMPAWAAARQRAAALCLQLQQLEACGAHLDGAVPAQGEEPWLWDLKARLALAREQPEEAQRCWREAIDRAHSQGDGDLAERLRQESTLALQERGAA